MTTEELQRLLDRSDSDKDHARYDARDKLDAMAIDMARMLIAAEGMREALKECDPAHFVGNGVVVVEADKWKAIDAAITAYDQACNQSAGEG